MSTGSESGRCEHLDQIGLYAMQALPRSEVSVLEVHIARCSECRQELETLRPIVESFVSWPTDVLRSSTSLWGRLTQRIAAETGEQPLLELRRGYTEPEWREVAPGIWCKLLATDIERNRVSMLVRLATGVEYPPHRHAGVEELHLLEGVLMVDEKTLYPGDYIRAEAGSADARVWSESGCTCVLIASPRDELLGSSDAVGTASHSGRKCTH